MHTQWIKWVVAAKEIHNRKGKKKKNEEDDEQFESYG